jgi:phage tail sheath protein FI
MPDYQSPGVYIEEVDSGARPIEGVGTSTAALVGFAAAGPANTAVLITNWSQYVEKFGRQVDGGRREPHLKGSYLSHAVYGYFLNGGGRCYVTRVGPTAAGDGNRPVLEIPGTADKPSLTVTPKENPGEDITIDIKPASGEPPPEGQFTVSIRKGDAEPETHENISLRQRGAKNLVAEVQSKWVVLAEAQAGGSLAERMPKPGTYVLPASQPAALPARAEDFVGDVTQRSGTHGLEVAEDVTMICCPDLMAAFQAGALDREAVKAVQQAMIDHCETMRDRVAILDPLPGLSPQEMEQWRGETNFDSKYAALYYPWIRIQDPDDSRQRINVPPCGHIAGVYARTDSQRGVHKAPANEAVRGALGADVQITQREQDGLNPKRVNCIRSFPGRGVRVWGARTLSDDAQWRYINVRRLFNYIEKSIERGTQWAVFEPNDPDLWARVRRDVSAFLTGVWRDGMLFGLTPAEAFFVKCDAELNPIDVRDRGELIIEVGLAPVKPAEFVIFRISQWAGGGA